MVVGAKAVAATVSAVGMVTLLSGMAVHFRNPRSADNDLLNLMADSGGAVAGRIVSIPVKDYKQAFKLTLKLGECPLVMENKNIKKCSEEFTGDTVFLAKGGMTVDVSRVQTSEDITTHIMGGVGASVGVLGLVSVSAKVNVAVTTDTTKKTLNMMSSYVMDKGILTLQHPTPKTPIPSGGALYLSEIELGGYELFLVTLDFESEKQKVEVEYTVTFKILFWSISAKVKYMHETFKSKASVKIQLKSSFREEKERSFNDVSLSLSTLEQLENEYMKGPQLLRELSNDDEKTHNFYYFSSWKESPYGANFNLALINHDLDFLNDQTTEMLSLLHRISKLLTKAGTGDRRSDLTKFNTTLTDKVTKLTSGLESYHKLSPTERQNLRDIYGEDKAPLYYSRELNTILEKA